MFQLALPHWDPRQQRYCDVLFCDMFVCYVNKTIGTRVGFCAILESEGELGERAIVILHQVTRHSLENVERWSWRDVPKKEIYCVRLFGIWARRGAT
jgi:hypothetical protein